MSPDTIWSYYKQNAINNAILPKIGNILVDLNIYLFFIFIFFNVPRAPASLHHSSSSSVCGDTDL